MKAIQLHDRWTEEIIGTVLLNEGCDEDAVTYAWDEFQKHYSSNAEKPGDIYEFYNQWYKIGFEVLDLDFYQPY